MPAIPKRKRGLIQLDDYRIQLLNLVKQIANGAEVRFIRDLEDEGLEEVKNVLMEAGEDIDLKKLIKAIEKTSD